jgi:GNAT superfamily N-acetyltransferase
VRIERFDPVADDGRLAVCHRLWQAAHRHDDPDGPPMSLAGFSGWWGTGSGEPRQVWLAAGDTGPAGCYLLEFPDRENTDLGKVVLVVEPGARRRGLGTALLTHCCEQARQAGRSRVMAETLRDTPGDEFGRAAGAEPGLTEIRRILPVDDALPARLARLRAEAEPAAADYELLTWFGPTPAEHLDQVAQVNEAMNDAPREDHVEPEHWDADRVRQGEERLARHSARLYSAAARHAATGEFAALTQLLTDPHEPTWAYQLLTAVAQPHRGHRLGLLVKAATHQWLTEAEPAVRRVTTWNSQTNRYMIAINEALGYRPSGRMRTWALNVSDSLARARVPSLSGLARSLKPQSYQAQSHQAQS